MSDDDDTLTPITKLTRDLRLASTTLGRSEARFLVDTYYNMQDARKRDANRIIALSKSNEPHAIIEWLFQQDYTMEKQIASALNHYSRSNELGKWARSVKGIGPVISAGLLAHIDITRAPTVGHIWRFAGLDPTQTWEKGKKRPWNASLKVLCWKIGQSFVKVSGYDDAFYGKVYLQRKVLETEANEQKAYAAQAEAILAKKRISKETQAYKAYAQGLLPPAHIHARACRYATKLFLAHYHEVGYKLEYGTEPPLPYAVAHLGHAHHIKAPHNG